MMIHELFMQLFDPFSWFTSGFWILIASYGAPIGGAIIIGILFIRKILRDRAPTQGKIGIYDMRIPHMSEDFSLTIYDIAVPKHIDRIINALIAAHKDNQDELNKVAAVIHMNRNNLHFYYGKYEDFDKSTRKDGGALVITTAPLDHSQYYREKSSGYDRLRGELVRSRIVADADVGAYIKDDADKWEGKDAIDYIFYPLKPLTVGVTLHPAQIKTLDIHFGVVAQMRQMLVTLERSKNNEIQVRAAKDGQRLAETGMRKATSRADREARARLKKTYWQTQLTTMGTPLSMALIALILGGFTIFGFEPLSRFAPGYQMWQYVAGAFAMGLVAVWGITRFMNPGEQ